MTQKTNHSLQSTPLGLIASDWKLGAVEDFVAELKAGVSVNAVETEGGCAADEIGVLKSGAVLQGKFFPEQHKVVVPTDRGRVATSVRADRIIISRMNTPALVGESGYVAEDAPHLFLPDRLWQTEPSNEPHSQRWLSYWLQHPAVRALIAAAATGTSNSMKNISKETVLSLPVPRTPLGEQTKIAAILTTLDDKLDVIARQIEATQTLKQGLMRMLFSQGVGAQDAGGRWVPHAEFKDTEQGRVPAAWSVQTLEQVAVVERGKFSARPRNDPKYFEGGDIPFVQTGDVAKSGRLISTASQFLNEAGLRVSKLFEPGTVFLTIAANIGDVAIAAIPMACPDSVVGIRAVEGACDPAWLYYLLSANKGYFDSRATQNAQKNINLQVLRPFRFAMPPPAEQAQIGLMLTALDEKLESLGRRLHHHQTLKRGLMQKLLTGEWRVKVDAEMAA